MPLLPSDSEALHRAREAVLIGVPVFGTGSDTTPDAFRGGGGPGPAG